MRESLLLQGRFFMIFLSEGLKPSAVAGGPSVIIDPEKLDGNEAFWYAENSC